MNEVAISAHPNLEQLPADLQQQLSEHVDTLSHESLLPAHIRTDEWSLDQGSSEVFDQEESSIVVEASKELQHKVNRVTSAMSAAYESITSETEIEAITSDDILKTAVVLQTKEAISTGENGDRESAQQAIETILLLDTVLSDDYSSSEAASSAVLDLVKAGFARDTVEAGIATRGIVSVPRSKDEFGREHYYARPASRVIAERLPLLQVASGLEFDSAMDSMAPLVRDGLPAEDVAHRTELIGKLDSEELVALAVDAQKNKANYQLASNYGLQALRKIEDHYSIPRVYAGRELAGTIQTVYDIVNTPSNGVDNTEQTLQLHTACNRLLSFRQPGLQPYRINSSITAHLDGAVVELMVLGREDIASELISGSDGEKKQLEGAFYYTLEHEHPDVTNEALAKIAAIHSEKAEHLRRSLSAIGIDEEKINDLLATAPAPELFLGLDQADQKLLGSMSSEFFHQLCQDYRLERNTTIIKGMMQAGITNPASIENYMPIFLQFNLDDGETAQQELQQGLRFLQTIEEYNEDQADSRRQIRVSDSDFYTAIRRFSNPEAVIDLYKATLDTLPITHRSSFTELLNTFTTDTEQIMITPELIEDLSYVQSSLKKIFPQGIPLHIGSAEAARNLAMLDFDGLQKVADRIKGIGESVGDYNQPDYSLTQLIESELVSGTLDKLVTDINNADESYLRAIYTLHQINGVFTKELLNYGLYSHDPDNAIQKQQQLARLLNGKFGAFLLDENYSFRQRDNLFGVVHEEEPEKVMENFELGLDIFGEFLDLEKLKILSTITSGTEIPEDLQELGITKNGEAGINQLKAALDKFTESIFSDGTIQTELVLRHPILRDYLKVITRFEDSQFGNHDDHTLGALLTVSEREDTTLRPEFTISDTTVATKDQEALANFDIPEDAYAEWKSYTESIQRAIRIVPSHGSINWAELGGLLRELQGEITARHETLSSGIDQLQEKIDKITEAGKDPSKLQAKLDEQKQSLTSLSDIDFENVQEFDITKLTQVIHELGTHKSIAKSGVLQSLLITGALIKSRAENGTLPSFLENLHSQPDLRSLSEMADLIGHVTNRETWSYLFGNVGGEKILNTVLSTDAIQNAIERSQSIESKGTKDFRIIPTRGPLMELSGHIGDACWASKYESIAREFPNITGIILVQNPGQKFQRLAGSALLIETVSATGEPLIVLRGLNPIENVITQLDTEDFTDQIFTYVRETAEKLGRKPAVVIDDHAGGSATNRPTLFTHLNAQRQHLRKVILASSSDTTFNGYNITNQSYLI